MRTNIISFLLIIYFCTSGTPARISAIDDLKKVFGSNTIQRGETFVQWLKQKFADIGEKKSQDVGEKTKFTDLSPEVQLIILNELEFKDLLTMATMNERLSLLVAYVYKRKYSEYTIKIQTPAVKLSGIKMQYVTFMESNKLISVEDFDASLLILKHFGAAVGKLHVVSNPAVPEQNQIIGDYIRKYCFAPLQLKIEASLEWLSEPFPMVTDLDIGLEYGTSKLGPLSALFPNLERLSVENTVHGFFRNPRSNEDELKHLMNGTFPHLQHFAANDIHYSYLEILLLQNPQIRSIDLNEVSPYFITDVSRLLPNLERIIVKNIDTFGKHIHFEHVNFFQVKDAYTEGPPSFISFSNLKELRFNFFYNDWIKLLRNNSHVERLHVQCYNEPLPIDQLTEHLDQLEELTVRTDDYTITEHLPDILKNHEYLTKFDCSIIDDAWRRNEFNSPDEILDEEGKNKWIIKENVTGSNLNIRLSKKC